VVSVGLLRRLAIPSTVSPTIMPAMMDSHGNPGMAGIVSGVVADEEAVREVVFAGIVVTKVCVCPPEVTTEVTTWDEELVAEVAGLEVVAVVLEIAAVLDVVAAVLDVVAEAVVVVPGAVVVAVTVLALTPPGGSR